MKTQLVIISVFLFLVTGTSMNAQRQNRIGYVDMDYILNNIPNYQEAMNRLNKKVQKWKGEIDMKQKEIDGLKEDLENERPLLTKDLIQEREDEIKYRQKKLQDYQQKRFGPEGDMIAQQRQIIKPIEDEVFNAVQEIGKKREYDFIFDSSSDALMLFSAKRHDISDMILQQINRSIGKKDRDKAVAERKEDKNSDKSDLGGKYKSVTKARKDKEEREERKEERQEQKDERQAEMDDRQSERDSIRQTRKEAMEKQRKQIIKDREARRDSLKKARKERMKKRKRERDSIRQARQKERENH